MTTTNERETTMENTARNDWNAILETPAWVKTLIHEAEKAGTYTTGIESDKKQRGSSINVDCYGYNEAEGLAVIQVRQCIFHPRRFNKVRKDYYLIGHTENGNVFAHPVETPARSKWALASPENTVAFVLSRIWDCPADELHLIVRQGDIAFVPAVLPKNAVESGNSIVLRDTHKITGKIFKAPDGTLYCERARAKHLKGQHAPVTVKGNYYRIQAGIRASVWGFTRPTQD